MAPENKLQKMVGGGWQDGIFSLDTSRTDVASQTPHLTAALICLLRSGHLNGRGTRWEGTLCPTHGRQGKGCQYLSKQHV